MSFFDKLILNGGRHLACLLMHIKYGLQYAVCYQIIIRQCQKNNTVILSVCPLFSIIEDQVKCLGKITCKISSVKDLKMALCGERSLSRTHLLICTPWLLCVISVFTGQWPANSSCYQGPFIIYVSKCILKVKALLAPVSSYILLIF